MKYRIEKDSMGEVKVPANALWGAQTQRAIANFPIASGRMPHPLVIALGIIKEQAALANKKLKLLKPELADPIARASSEVASGLHYEHFPVDIFQTGSGTSTNMNANEVIANRASQIAGKGLSRRRIHPNDHVNMCQSSNDVFPSAIHIASYIEIDGKLLPSLKKLKRALDRKGSEFDDVIKVGRTHLQDAVPIRLGQEFSAFSAQMERSTRGVMGALSELSHLALGGTAIGTGVNAHPDFASQVIQGLSRKTGLPFKRADNLFESIACKGALVRTSSALKELAVDLSKIANDIRWLASGPRAGIAEIKIPELQPGSSIMPGKVNPVIPEMLLMICAQVIANDLAVTQGGMGGNLELNVMMPLIARNILESINLLSNGINVFISKCVEGITADRKRCARLVESSLMTGTALTNKLGYDRVADLAKEAYNTGKSIKEVVLEKRILDPLLVEKLLDLSKMTGK